MDTGAGPLAHWKGRYLPGLSDGAIGALVDRDPDNVFHLNHNIIPSRR